MKHTPGPFTRTESLVSSGGRISGRRSRQPASPMEGDRVSGGGLVEQADVVVVGARLAGCAVAAPLARAGRKVVVLDKMSFPSDQLSTHVLTPGGTSVLAKLGALPRNLALNPSQVRWVTIVAEGVVCTERMRPEPDGIDFGLCVPRDLQDACLVEAVREQGAEVRERCTVSSLHWRAGR